MLNKQGEGKIDWCDYSWNPISGCKHRCSYCYMQRIVKRFNFDMTPTFYPKRLNDLNKLKTPSKIFVCSSGDIFSPGVKDEWIQKVIDTIKNFPEHTFQLISKNPKRYKDFQFPNNCWLGTCVDGLAKTKDNITTLKFTITDNLKFVSFEPLIKEVDVDLEGFKWVIIGGDSTHNAEKPPDEWVDKIMEETKKYDIPVFIKNNYKYKRKVKEFPKLK